MPSPVKPSDHFSSAEGEKHKQLHREIRDMVSAITHRVTDFHKPGSTHHLENNEEEHGVSMITLAGTNNGATMRSELDEKSHNPSHDDDDEPYEALSTYVNSNFQAINNSIMLGGSYHANDPGVQMDISDFITEHGSQHKGDHKHGVNQSTITLLLIEKMQSSPLLFEEPIRMASILEPSKPSFFPAMTKIVGTLGPKSRSVDVISHCLDAGMSVARFDFSWGDPEYHQETLENLKAAIKCTKKLCAVMLDTVGPELQVVNKTEHPISLEADTLVVLTPDQNKEATSNLLPVNFSGLSKAVKSGDTIFIGQYLFTGSETTSVWLEVKEVEGDDVTCVIKNSATLAGSLYTLHVSQIRIDLPTLTDKDKEVISTWGVKNNIDFLSLSYTRHAEDVRHAREFLSKLGDLKQTQIFAKIENIEGLTHFDEILSEADSIILSRGNLGIDLPPEKVFLFQKAAIYKCNMAGKPAVVTRVVDTMTDNLRPTRAEATDVANAVLDGSDAIVLGAETLRGLYPVETISVVGKICAEAEKVYNQDLYFKRTVRYVGEPMTHLESITSSAVRAAIKVKASVIICFTSSGRAARLIAKYRPTMPVISVVIPQLKTNQVRWTFTGAFQARQSLIVRGLFPMLADPRHPAESNSGTNESILKVALDHGKAYGIIKPHERVVVCQKVGDSSVVKIIELED